MKKVLLALVTVIGFGIISNAQDVITLKNGTDINALVQKVGDIEIEYKRFDNTSGPNYTLKKSEILMIRYENGTKDIFLEETKPAETKIRVDDLKEKRQSATNCAKNSAFGLDIGLGGTIETINNIKFPTSYFASALGIRAMHHFNPYFGVDFFKINWITDVLTSESENDWLMRLQIMPGIRGNSPVFFKCMSVYSAFRLGYGMTFVPKQYGVNLASHFEGLCLETELGLNLTPTVFAGFAYNYHKYFVKGVDSKRALHTLSFRLGFNFGKSQETIKTEKPKAEVEKVTVGARNRIFDIDSKAREIVAELMFDGYTVCTDEIVDLKQGESGSHIKSFEGGAEYIIICFSDDPNVLDITSSVQHRNGKIAADDAIDRGEINRIHFKPKFLQRLKVVATNLSSRTPNSESECRMIIVFKN